MQIPPNPPTSSTYEDGTKCALSTFNPSPRRGILENLAVKSTVHVSISTPSSSSLKRKRLEASIGLFKRLLDPSDAYLAFSDVSLDPSPNKLFGQLKSKITRFDLFGVVDNDLHVLAELKELVSKLVRPEAPSAIFFFFPRLGDPSRSRSPSH